MAPLRPLLLATLVFLVANVSVAHASTIPAGFAPGTLWLSKEQASVGDLLTLSTVLYNASVEPVSGTLVFLVDDAKLSEVPFTENPGESRLFQSSWTASVGTHTFGARVSGASGTTLALATSSLAHITIAAPVPIAVAAPVSVPDVTKSFLSSTGLASSSPTIAHAVVAVASSSEAVRESVVATLEASIGDASSTPGGTVDSKASSSVGSVLGAQIEKADDSPVLAKPTGDHLSWFDSLRHGTLVALLTIARSPALWYPFLALILFVILFIVFKRLRHPKK